MSPEGRDNGEKSLRNTSIMMKSLSWVYFHLLLGNDIRPPKN